VKKRLVLESKRLDRTLNRAAQYFFKIGSVNDVKPTQLMENSVDCAVPMPLYGVVLHVTTDALGGDAM
jgi:hypothetical protein